MGMAVSWVPNRPCALGLQAVTISMGIHFLSGCAEKFSVSYRYIAPVLTSKLYVYWIQALLYQLTFAFPYCNICASQILSHRHRLLFSPLRWSKWGIKAEISKDIWGFNGCWFQELACKHWRGLRALGTDVWDINTCKCGEWGFQKPLHAWLSLKPTRPHVLSVLFSINWHVYWNSTWQITLMLPKSEVQRWWGLCKSRSLQCTLTGTVIASLVCLLCMKWNSYWKVTSGLFYTYINAH